MGRIERELRRRRSSRRPRVEVAERTPRVPRDRAGAPMRPLLLFGPRGGGAEGALRVLAVTSGAAHRAGRCGHWQRRAVAVKASTTVRKASWTAALWNDRDRPDLIA